MIRNNQNSQMNSGLSFRILSVDFLACVGIVSFMLRLGGAKNSKTKQAFSTICGYLIKLCGMLKINKNKSTNFFSEMN